MMLMARVCPEAVKTRSGKVVNSHGERHRPSHHTVHGDTGSGHMANHEASKTHLLLALECLRAYHV